MCDESLKQRYRFGIRKSKLESFCRDCDHGGLFLTGQSVAADQVGEQAQVQTQGQATTSDPQALK